MIDFPHINKAGKRLNTKENLEKLLETYLSIKQILNKDGCYRSSEFYVNGELTKSSYSLNYLDAFKTKEPTYLALKSLAVLHGLPVSALSYFPSIKLVKFEVAE